MAASDVILGAISYAVDQAMAKYRLTDIATVVTAADLEKEQYTVLIDGQSYHVRDGVNIRPKAGTLVWVHLPNGNLNHAYISAKR